MHERPQLHQVVLQGRAGDEQAALGGEVEQRLRGEGRGRERGGSEVWVGGWAGGSVGRSGCGRCSCCTAVVEHQPHSQPRSQPHTVLSSAAHPTCQRWDFQFLIMCASSSIRYFHFLRLNMRASCGGTARQYRQYMRGRYSRYAGGGGVARQEGSGRAGMCAANGQRAPSCSRAGTATGTAPGLAQHPPGGPGCTR